MIDVNDLRKGVTFELEGNLFKVVEYSHHKPGRGNATIKIKARNLRTGSNIEKTFISGSQVQEARLDFHTVQYLYNDGAKFYFMDDETYEQFELASGVIGDQAGYMKEGDRVQAQVFDGRVINVELPKNVPLKVTYTEDAVKGDTSSSITKDAQLETGAKVKVPAFIKQGDVISVDTSTGAYRERVKD